MAFGAKIRSRFLVPVGVSEQQLGDGIADDIGDEQVEGAFGPNDYDREHRPKRYEEEVKEPPDPGCEDADHGKKSDNAEDEGPEQDALSEREVRLVDISAGGRLCHGACFRPRLRHLAALQSCYDGFYALFDTAVIVPCLKSGRHNIADDPPGQ